MPKAAQRTTTIHGEPDYWFDKLKEAEYEPCFWYEIRRERLCCHRAEIMRQVAELDQSGEGEDEKFRLKLELQEELDQVKRAERPFLKLTPAERQRFMEEDPVRLAKEVSPGERWLGGRKQFGVELWIDLRHSNDDLAASFKGLLARLRHQGEAKFTGHGRPTSIKLRLFSLSVYRCLRRSMRPDEAWNHLARLRDEFCIGEHNRTKLSELVRKIEREIGIPPS